MSPRAILRGDAGFYRVQGAIWELGPSTYRTYVHLIPATPHRDLFVSVNAATMQEALGAAKARVIATTGTPVENLEVRATTQRTSS